MWSALGKPFGLLASLAAVSAVAAAGGAEQGQCQASEPAVAARSLTAGPAMIQRGRPSISRSALEPGESLLASEASGEVGIATYNLYWWNVRQNSRWSELHDRIRGQRPFDLVGFQECEDVASVVRSAGLDGFDYFQGPAPNPCPLAWSTAAFARLGEPGSEWVAKDQWGDRWFTYVRLRHIATGVPVLFVNTHGPLGQCGSALGHNWANGVTAKMQPGDVVFMTGDYNCGTGSGAMNIIKGMLSEAVDGGIDQILTNNAQVLSGGTSAGWPSDHPFVKGSFRLSGSGPTPSPTPSQPSGNNYRKVAGVGGWGGFCTCPDGQRYNVGDNGDGCGSLACEGGTAGKCDKREEASRKGMKVTCSRSGSQPTPSPSPSPDDAPCSCVDFSEWPSVDGGVTCGDCTALVLTAPYGNRCDEYCESFGHVCMAAGEEVAESCQVENSYRCDEEISLTSDMLCTCHLP